MSFEDYRNLLISYVSKAYEVASKVRGLSNDPSPLPEVRLVSSQAEAIEHLVGLEGLGKRITELFKELPRQEVPLKIAEEIVYGKFGHHSEEDVILLALRAALSVLTPPGTTAAPIEGIVDVKIKLNKDKTRYLAVYYAGPMRSAGGTEQGLSVIFADYIRRLMKLDRYEPSEEEIGRYVEEMRLYEKHVGSFQFKATEEQLRFALRRIPIEITGIGTDPYEVTTHRDLLRVGTNKLRGGALRVIIDGLIGRAQKIYKQVKKLDMPGWDWLLEVKAISHEPIYMEKILIGRPFLSSSNAFGGLRLRYGRSRTTGLAAVGIHPMSMYVVNSFIAIGSQIRLDKPGKSSSVVPVDSLEPPIVKLKDGSVVRIDNEALYFKYKDSIEKILFLGDILISIGDYIENDAKLDRPGFCEEWWAAEVDFSVKNTFKSLDEASAFVEIPTVKLEAFIKNPLSMRPTFEEALKISYRLKVPIHPYYLDFWERATAKQAFLFLNKLKQLGRKNLEGYIELPLEPEIKEFLELLCVPHRILGNSITIGAPSMFLLEKLSSLDIPPFRDSKESASEYISSILGIKFIPKSSSFLSARVGRPEAANLRLMTPPVHVIFPIGHSGGPSRNILAALLKNRTVSIEVADRVCPSCNTRTFYLRCDRCHTKTLAIYHCIRCGATSDKDVCTKCGTKMRPYSTLFLDSKSLLSQLSGDPYGVKMIKGVKFLMNDMRVPEPLKKGFLRAKWGLSVFRDGTCRFDATNIPVTAFKLKEVGLSVERAIFLGYSEDINGDELKNVDQIVYINPQDVIIPKSAVTFLLNLSKFIDAWLELHGLPPFYNTSSKEDLIGHAVAAISPHTLGAIVGRIIGFTESDVCMSHPFFHQAKRRDCDGDADAFTLLLDVLINFSPYYLPSHSGGKMDSPLVMFAVINPVEIDDQIFNTENISKIPKAFYDIACAEKPASSLINILDFVKPFYQEPIKFTHPVSDFSRGPKKSTYRTLGSMKEKLDEQISLTGKLISLSAPSVIEHILDAHLIKDVVGNLRAFYTQKYRCKKCNRKFRRVPLTMRCTSCGGEIAPTVHAASVVKYASYIRELTDKYDVGNYYKESVKAIMNEISWFSKSLPENVKEFEADAHKDTRKKILDFT
ncbi:MAG: DNA polymerase II large subunit [Thermoproteota archaeon]